MWSLLIEEDPGETDGLDTKVLQGNESMSEKIHMARVTIPDPDPHSSLGITKSMSRYSGALCASIVEKGVSEWMTAPDEHCELS